MRAPNSIPYCLPHLAKKFKGDLVEIQTSFELHPVRFAKFAWQNFKKELIELNASSELFLVRSATLGKIFLKES